MNPSTAHKRLKDLATLRLGQSFPGELRLWSQSAGEAFPRGTVSAAVAWLLSAPITAKRIKECFGRMVPITMGMPGIADSSGVVRVRTPSGAAIGVRLEVEIKIDDDPQRESQEEFEALCIRMGAIYLLIRGDATGANHEAVCAEAAMRLGSAMRAIEGAMAGGSIA